MSELESVLPALRLVSDGYDVQVAADTGASPTRPFDDMAEMHRKERCDAHDTNQLIAELACSWTMPEGGELVQVMMEALQS